MVNDYIMAKVVSSRISDRLRSVMGLVSSRGAASPRYGTGPMTRGIKQLGRTDVRNDKTLAKLLRGGGLSVDGGMSHVKR